MKKTLWAAIILFTIVLGSFAFLKYVHFRYNAIDLAYYNQVFWKTIHGEPFGLTIHPHLSLGDHVEPFLLLLVPFYWLWPDARMLLLLQIIALALTAWPIYKIVLLWSVQVGATRFTPQSLAQGERAWSPTTVGGVSPSGSAFSSPGKTITSLRSESVATTHQKLALILALLWLLNPLVHNIALFEFHILPFALPFLFLTFLAYEKKQLVRFTIWSLLALSVREDVTLAIGAFALLAFVDMIRKKRSWIWIVLPLVLAGTWFVLAQSIAAHYAADGNYKFLVYYAWLGNTFTDVVFNFLRHPFLVLAHIATAKTVLLFLALGIPFLFLFLLSPRVLLLALPPLAQHLLASYGGDPAIAQIHYVTLLLPPLVIGTLLTLLHPPRFLSPQLLRILLVVATLYSMVTPLGPLYGMVTIKPDREDIQKRAAMIARIPDDASIATTESFLTPLSNRNALFLLRYVFAGTTQYGKKPYILPPSVTHILLDTNDLIAYITNDPAILRKTFASFGVIAADGPFLLLKRNEGLPLVTESSSKEQEVGMKEEFPCSVPPLSRCTHVTVTSVGKKNTYGQSTVLIAEPTKLILPFAYGIGNDTPTTSHYWIPVANELQFATTAATHTMVLTHDRAVDYKHIIDDASRNVIAPTPRNK